MSKIVLHQTPGAIATLALYYAKCEAKAQLKAQGIRVQYVEAKDITAAGRALLQERWTEFASKAEACLTKINTEAQKRKPPKSKTSAVQNSPSNKRRSAHQNRAIIVAIIKISPQWLHVLLLIDRSGLTTTRVIYSRLRRPDLRLLALGAEMIRMLRSYSLPA
jgi:hypothetical protein